MRVTLVLVLGTFALLGAHLVACVRPIDIHTANLPTAPFAQYHTFSFGDAEGSPQGYKMSPRSVEVQRRLKPIIAGVLQEKGYTPAPGKGDFVVAYGSGRREGDVFHPEKSHDWLDENEDDDFVEGSIVLDVFDGSNDGQVWHGATRAGINPEKIDAAQLDRSVRLLLAHYPAAVLPTTDGGAGG
jgi:uncharacterized protein DUF4136